MEENYMEQMNKAFYKQLSKEIQLLFRLPPNDFNKLIYYEGTYGWSTAIFNSCRKLHKDNLAKYYNNLNAFKSDELDSAIVEHIIELKTRKIYVPKKFDSMEYYKQSYKENDYYLKNLKQ